MADKKISELNVATAVYDADDLPIVQSAETKQVGASVLKAYMGDAPTIVGGTIDATPVGVSTQAAGSFTTLDSSSTTTLNGTVIPASKTLVSTDASQTLTNKTISGSSNTLSNIGNASLTNSSITFGSTATSLGGTVSALNGVTIGQSTAAAGSFTTLTASDASIISVNSSSNALRITQTGAGNALVVEDSANPDATPFVVDASGRVIVGYTSSQTFGGLTLVGLQINGTSQGASSIATTNWAASTTPTSHIFSKSRGGAVGTHTALNTNDNIGNLQFEGSDGTAFIPAAAINVYVDGTPGTNNMPGRLVFSTTKDGASSPTEALRIKNTQESWFQANNSTSAVTITQTGAGNALVVEDSANPDATPFVVDANGIVVSGNTTALNGYSGTATRQTSSFEAVGGNASGTGLAIFGFSTSSTARATVNFNKSNSTTIGAHASVADGNVLGGLHFSGSDGVDYIPAAQIYGVVDGTPGTNDMPGRLVFSTTADGASSPTERMRIDSAGRVGIGGTSYAGNTLNIQKALTGATTAQQVNVGFTINSDVTSSAVVVASYPATQAAAFTLSNLKHFSAAQGTIGAGSAVTNQYGFNADSGLTGATNNYGFHSNIASGTGRWNFYAAGTADNYFAGKVGIGAAAATGENFSITKNVDTTATAFGIRNLSYVNQATTTAIYGISDQTQLLSPASVTTLIRFYAAAGSFTGTATNQYGYYANNNLTGATNNYGVYSNIASGTGRYNFYANGTADNYLAGSLGIGQTSLAGWSLRTNKSVTGATAGGQIAAEGQIASDVTGTVRQFSSYSQTAVAAFTLNSLSHFAALQGTFGAGSTVTTQHGYFADPSLTGATNNYGFYSNIASGTGRYNFYANGTADNYFAGRVGIGSTAASITTLNLSLNMTGGTTTYGVLNLGTVQSDSTSQGIYFRTNVSTAAAAFTLSDLYHYQASQGTFGAGSTVTNQYGFSTASTLTGATNNYGFYSNIASGTGRYNFYAAGTAANYLGGDLTFKPLASATPANNGDLTFEATSNTSVKIKLKGSDGVVRSVTLTLA